jgi:hypothetical protein
LLNIPKLQQKEALKAFKVLLRIMRDRMKPKVCDDKLMIQFLLERAVLFGNMRDELYVQLVKQLSCNPGLESVRKGWELLACYAGTFPPSKNFEEYLRQFLQAHAHDCANQFVHPKNPLNQDIMVLATHCIKLLDRCCRNGPRGKTPSEAEIERMMVAAFQPSVFGETLDSIMYVIYFWEYGGSFAVDCRFIFVSLTQYFLQCVGGCSSSSFPKCITLEY